MLTRFFPEAHLLPCLSFAGVCWRMAGRGGIPPPACSKS